MFKLSVGIIFATICVVVLNAALDDEVKQFQFTKAQDGSDEFNFEYGLDNGEVYRGQTIVLLKDIAPIQLMMGADSFYWTEMTHDENQNPQPFSKFVRLVEQTDSALAHFKDDRFEYVIDKEGQIQKFAYVTEWDLENVAFSPLGNENKTFNYVISSLNNSKKHNGTTNYEADPHMQGGSVPTFIDVCPNGFQVYFTDEELSYVETFYKNVEQFVINCPYGSSAAAAISQEISPNALKSLVG